MINIINRIRSVIFLLPAWFAPHSKIRVFFHRLRGVDIGSNVEIGYFAIIANIDPSRVRVEKGATITAKCVLLEHDNAHLYTNRGDQVNGNITICEGAFIGIGSIVLPGVCIGPHAIVGAMSLVNRDVGARETWAGIPARKLKD